MLVTALVVGAGTGAGLRLSYIYDHLLQLAFSATLVSFGLSLLLYFKSLLAPETALAPGGNSGEVPLGSQVLDPFRRDPAELPLWGTPLSVPRLVGFVVRRGTPRMPTTRSTAGSSRQAISTVLSRLGGLQEGDPVASRGRCRAVKNPPPSVLRLVGKPVPLPLSRGSRRTGGRKSFFCWQCLPGDLVALP